MPPIARGGRASIPALQGAFQRGAFRRRGENGLSNRAYDQATGQWTQEDPAGIAGGLNLTQFNGNNPVAYSDPFGLKACPGIANTDQDNLDDCPARSPQFYAARLAKGQGNAIVNNLPGG